LKGNEFTSSGRLIEMSSLTDNRFFRWEFSVDFFAGVIFGLFHEDSPIIYGAIVNDYKAEAAVNITANWKIQIMNFIKTDLEVQFTPIMGTVGMKTYSTSYLGDNCVWVYDNYHVA
jgi:hypothetical protein